MLALARVVLWKACNTPRNMSKAEEMSFLTKFYRFEIKTLNKSFNPIAMKVAPHKGREIQEYCFPNVEYLIYTIQEFHRIFFSRS